MDDFDLEMLGNYFVANNLVNEGWEFHKFVDAWQQGSVVIENKKARAL